MSWIGFPAGRSRQVGAVVASMLLAACAPATPTQPTSAPASAATSAPQATTAPAAAQPSTAAPAAAVQPTAAPPAAAPAGGKKGTIRVAFGLPLGNPSNPFAWIGKELGYFDEEGIDVEIISTSGNNAQADAMLLSNQIDVGIFGLDPVLLPVASGKTIPARAVFNVQNRSQYEGIVLEDSPIKELTDLKGKKVAIPQLGGTLERYLAETLKSVNLSLDDIQFIATGIGVPMAEALKRGDADVGFATRGQIGPIELAGYKLRYLPRPAFAEQFITGNMIARSDLSPDKEAALKGYLRAYAKSIVFTKENPEAAIRISWKMYPDGKPKSVADDKALADAIKVNTDYMAYIDKQNGKWGYMPPDRLQYYAQYLGVADKIPDLTKYYTNDYIDFANDFDEARVREQARNWKP